MKLNIEKWNARRIALEAGIVALKEQIRCPGHYISWKEARELDCLKVEATRLYQLRAHLRKHLHSLKTVHYKGNEKIVEPMTLERQAEDIKAWTEDYLIEEPAIQACSA